MARIIKNTSTEAQHDWPDDVFIQGGKHGVVLGGPGGGYQTAFFEAFPEGTFLRGEGATLAEAEERCWKQYQVYTACDGTGQPHGPYERRQYRNGAGFCTRCGTWMNKVFEPLPEEEKPTRRSLLDRVFVDQDPEAIGEVLDAVADAASLPQKPDTDTTAS
ncbi:hypothetical protein OG497_38190 [Streptomyces sp. NBC_01242]|uniref:hypothetical protein n=1 Tax=Streptomyces sp. NBC_01242 TaxID=2903795 RepID=UPI002259E65D|nr:hypothetical protein [Streptomyces sp. NBC_01242]MCX4799691.1 hypothetical protein [Streptomyces sp. NBC_01242]